MKFSRSYWQERLKSLSAYSVIAGIVFAIYILIMALVPKGSNSKTTTNVGHAEKIINITKNAPDNLKEGLYVSLSSDRATVGVFKQMTNNFRISLGAGSTYDQESVAEVKAEVSF